jgi:hypothetical protein
MEYSLHPVSTKKGALERVAAEYKQTAYGWGGATEVASRMPVLFTNRYARNVCARMSLARLLHHKMRATEQTNLEAPGAAEQFFCQQKNGGFFISAPSQPLAAGRQQSRFAARGGADLRLTSCFRLPSRRVKIVHAVQDGI